MKIDVISYEKYSIINCNDLPNLNLLIDFLNRNILDCPHLIINFLKSNVDKNIIISSLVPFYLNWQKRNKSFILVSNIRKESLKDLVSIKSLEEAIDFFHMEELTRSI